MAWRGGVPWCGVGVSAVCVYCGSSMVQYYSIFDSSVVKKDCVE